MNYSLSLNKRGGPFFRGGVGACENYAPPGETPGDTPGDIRGDTPGVDSGVIVDKPTQNFWKWFWASFSTSFKFPETTFELNCRRLALAQGMCNAGWLKWRLVSDGLC